MATLKRGNYKASDKDANYEATNNAPRLVT